MRDLARRSQAPDPSSCPTPTLRPSRRRERKKSPQSKHEHTEREKEPSAQASAVSAKKRKGPFLSEWALGSVSVRSAWSRTDSQGRMSPPTTSCGLVSQSITPSEKHNKFSGVMRELPIYHYPIGGDQSATLSDRASRVVARRSGSASFALRGTMNTFSLAAPLVRPAISRPEASGAARAVSRTESSR